MFLADLSPALRCLLTEEGLVLDLSSLVAGLLRTGQKNRKETVRRKTKKNAQIAPLQISISKFAHGLLYSMLSSTTESPFGPHCDVMSVGLRVLSDASGSEKKRTTRLFSRGLHTFFVEKKAFACMLQQRVLSVSRCLLSRPSCCAC